MRAFAVQDCPVSGVVLRCDSNQKAAKGLAFLGASPRHLRSAMETRPATQRGARDQRRRGALRPCGRGSRQASSDAEAESGHLTGKWWRRGGRWQRRAARFQRRGSWGGQRGKTRARAVEATCGAEDAGATDHTTPQPTLSLPHPPAGCGARAVRPRLSVAGRPAGWLLELHPGERAEQNRGSGSRWDTPLRGHCGDPCPCVSANPSRVSVRRVGAAHDDDAVRARRYEREEEFASGADKDVEIQGYGPKGRAAAGRGPSRRKMHPSGFLMVRETKVCIVFYTFQG